MKWGTKFKDVKDIKEKTFFAWRPVTLRGETRWLETVTVTGCYFVGVLTEKCYFMAKSFKDKT